ncbi:MAG: hypothetical protein OQL08_04460 [Gammaproteobacteria bacterium]|nr:hypothetical protein [Gammaproteobacteria bacterium]
MFFRKKKPVKEAARGGAGGDGGFDAELLHDLSSHFAIGEQILLRPEYIRELEVKSIVVGMLVNQRVIYANEDLSWDEASRTMLFHSRDDVASISRVETFALLLPLENSDDRKMSYQRKEELSRVGLFKRGNTITAMSAGGGHSSYTIDGLVTGYMRLRQGLFVNHEVAVLDFDADSFKVSERRKYQRLLTAVPATVRALKGERVFDALLVDFVEDAGRFLIDDPAASAVLLEGKPVGVSVEMSELDRRYRLEGAVRKVEGNQVVVRFRNIFKEGAFTPFTTLDGIEIKAMLQKLPQSRPA